MTFNDCSLRRAGRPTPIVPAVLVVLVVAVAVAVGAVGASATTGPTSEARWPLSPRPEVVDGFDPPAGPYGPGHRGVDLAGRPGQPVRAALPGRVTYAGRLAGRGVVVVDHGSTRTTYEPVAAAVNVGRYVDAGEVIGALEATRGHCWPATCLHWGLLRETEYLDPLSLLGPARVRLLPLDRGPVALSPTAGPATAQARGWAWRYAARNRSALTWV
jgi:murein DD-endopeptidase MepM/ murein hydrolase activator NlpD